MICANGGEADEREAAVTFCLEILAGKTKLYLRQELGTIPELLLTSGRYGSNQFN